MIWTDYEQVCFLKYDVQKNISFILWNVDEFALGFCEPVYFDILLTLSWYADEFQRKIRFKRINIGK